MSGYIVPQKDIGDCVEPLHRVTDLEVIWCSDKEPQTELIVVKKIGSGEFNTVYETTDASGNNLDLVLRIFHKPVSQSKAIKNELTGYELQKYFNEQGCSYIPKIHQFGLLPNGKPYGIIERVIDNAEMGIELFDFYSLPEWETLTFEEIRNIFLNIAKAVKCLHDEGFGHLDLKPENQSFKNQLFSS